MNRQQRRAAERQGKPAAPPAADPVFAQAVQLQQAGRFPEAEALYRQVLSRNPRHADALHLLGLLHHQTGRPEAAVELMGKAIAVDGAVAVFHNNFGSALKALGRHAAAEPSLRTALRLRPDYPKALSNLAEVLQAQGRFSESAEAYRRLLQQFPAAAELHGALGGVLLADGNADEAIVSLRRVVDLQPGASAAWFQLATALHAAARLTESVEACRQGLIRSPGEAEAFNGLGNALANLGELDEAVDAYRQAIALEPGNLSARSNLLMTLHSLSGVSATQILEEARAYAAQVEPRPEPAFGHDRDPERPLRIGYVSADFRVHPVGFFLDRVLPAHDAAQVEIILYDNGHFPDDQTARLRAASAGWRSIAGVPDAQARAMIEADGIDILIDLAGHSGANRLPLFALRPAPVQAAWLGYFGTTGLSSLDYVVGDAVILPTGDEAVFSEQPLRLAAPYLCWSPPRAEAPGGPFPGLTNGVVTFGSFNNRAKLNAETLAAWADILRRVQGSRLFFKSWSFADPGCRAAVVAAFEARGVDGARLDFAGLTPRVEALSAYNRVDIALDPFPFGGCTTTADTLWMGVPLVTQAGDRWSGRMSQTILASLGLDEWVAADTAGYVETAVRLAGDLASLAPVRAGLRSRLEQSAFCDGPRMAEKLEAAYRAMWRTWCARSGPVAG